jgi:hypothetical protein
MQDFSCAEPNGSSPMLTSEHKRAYMLKWRAENKARIAETRRAYYLANKGKENQQSRDKYWQDPNASRKRGRDYYKANTRKALNACREWQRNNPERHKELKRASYWRHVEWCRAKSRGWYRNNTERHREYSKKYTTENRGAILERTKKWAAANRELVRSIKKQWKLRNPEAAAEYKNRRRSREGVAQTSKEQKAIMRCVYKTMKRVSDCTGVPFHVDHIVPISRGGLHAPSNLQVIPAKWNLVKTNKLNVEIPILF